MSSLYCSVIFLNLKLRNWSQSHCCQTNQFVTRISVPEGTKYCDTWNFSGFLGILSVYKCLFSSLSILVNPCELVHWWILRYWWAGYWVLFSQGVNRIIRIFIMWISWNLWGPHLDNHFVSWDRQTPLTQGLVSITGTSSVSLNDNTFKHFWTNNCVCWCLTN